MLDAAGFPAAPVGGLRVLVADASGQAVATAPDKLVVNGVNVASPCGAKQLAAGSCFHTLRDSELRDEGEVGQHRARAAGFDACVGYFPRQ